MSNYIYSIKHVPAYLHLMGTYMFQIYLIIYFELLIDNYLHIRNTSQRALLKDVIIIYNLSLVGKSY